MRITGIEPINADWTFTKSFGTYEMNYAIYTSGKNCLACRFENGVKTAEIYSKL